MGEFDDLPGAGKPPPTSGTRTTRCGGFVDGPSGEELDLSLALPVPLQLRKEAASFPESLAGLRTEAAVREVLEDFNRRVRRDRMRPPEPGMPQLLAPTVDVDDLVERWRALRAASQPPEVDPPVTTGKARPRRRWWRRRR